LTKFALGQSEYQWIWVHAIPFPVLGSLNYFLFNSAALEAAILNPIFGLYTSNASAPLQAEQGLRQLYEFGLYSYCAFVDERQGTCGNHTIGEQFTPYDAITADMSSNYSFLSSTLIPETTFQDSKYLGQSSKAAYWMILFGTICAALALLTFVFSVGLASYSHRFYLTGG